MNVQDFFLSALALFVLFFLVAPMIQHVCNRTERIGRKRATAAKTMQDREQVRRAS